MHKYKVLALLGLAFFTIFSLNFVSSYHHTTFPVSDTITFSEDIRGEDRGFTLRRTTDVSRLTPYGYYDWSYRPHTIYYPDAREYKISDRLALQAFRTFQRDSQDQSRIDLERARHKFRYPHRGFYGTHYYRGYY